MDGEGHWIGLSDYKAISYCNTDVVTKSAQAFENAKYFFSLCLCNT